MAAITSTAGQVSPARPGSNDTVIYPRLAAVALTAGQSVFVNSTGTVDLCDTSAAGKQQCRGIALQTVGAGQAVDVLEQGEVEGYNLASLAFEAFVFASDTPGALADTAGTKTVQIGRVVPSTTKDSSGNVKKLLRIQSDLIRNW